MNSPGFGKLVHTESEVGGKKKKGENQSKKQCDLFLPKSLNPKVCVTLANHSELGTKMV